MPRIGRGVIFIGESLRKDLHDLIQGQREARMTRYTRYIDNELEKVEERLLRRLQSSQNRTIDSFEIECSLDSNGKILEMSSQSLRLLQFASSEMIGMNLEVFISETDIAKWRKVLLRILDEESVIHTELSHNLKYEGIAILRWSFFMNEDRVIHCKAKDETAFLKNILDALVLSKEIDKIQTLLRKVKS
ncbi:PAS domain S-box protein [Leptospira adleri]|nr:PAS domain S-box protein [Leptospira adleri]